MNTSDTSSCDRVEFQLPEVLHQDIYAELRRLAAIHIERQRKDLTLQPTGLVHEAWMRLAREGRKWRDCDHFFAAASLTMRRILIDQARRRARLCHGKDFQRISWVALDDLAAPGRSDMILLLDEGITQLEKLHPQRARVVIDRFFGGLTTQEIAQRLGIGQRSVERHWAMAKIWLLRWIQGANVTQEEVIA